MEVVHTPAEVRQRRREMLRQGESLGFVPTMGYLHEGHLSLVRAARRENNRVGVSIFVNPTQFNDAEDLESYPRDEERDRRLLQQEGVDLLYAPEAHVAYPDGFRTTVRVEELTERLEGAHRPGHFDGVVTIVTKLFATFYPDRAYFGAKDAQQARVIQQLSRDLDFGIDIRVMPIVREEDGLAMSSRNNRLSPEDRRRALRLYAALTSAKRQIETEQATAEDVRKLMKRELLKEEGVKPDYVSVADPNTLQELSGSITRPVLISLAAYVGGVRLIDNLTVSPTGSDPTP